MQQLKRELGIFGAIMMGLGSIIGTGIFVSVGISASIAGASVIIAIMIAALVATFNGLNSAQLAANHPVSGGTYEYAYCYLHPRAGFVAGWMFLLAKSASAATAALGFSGYLLDALAIEAGAIRVLIALIAVILITMIVLMGIRRSNTANTIIVSLTVITLLVFIVAGMPSIEMINFSGLLPQQVADIPLLLEATALMFVAYTGYGRIATLGEEVRAPRYTIPRAMIATLVVTMFLYTGVAFTGVGTIGADALALAAQSGAAPLEVAAQQFAPGITPLIVIAAVIAMLGVLLNLLLGLSRVLMAMGRRGDMPPAVARLNEAQTTPYVAVIVIALLIAGLVLTGNVRLTWSFSAFSVLVYYALTNLCALQLTAEERLFPRWVAIAGLGSCIFLAFWVEPIFIIAGFSLIIIGLIWQSIANRLFTVELNEA